MPDVDGLEVCTRLRSDQRLERLPIIILTAGPEMEKPAIAAGADRFVSKPFDLDELGGPVDELLAGPEGRQNGIRIRGWAGGAFGRRYPPGCFG